ncbi:MAG: hypothetical protein ACI865_002902 [Flavobacteriaceae bacterium]|jgi:hypothetical protein
MLKIILLLTSITAFVQVGSAQEIISTSGQFDSGSQGSLSWTIGEPITETTWSSTAILTQGFQQDFERFVGVSELYNTDEFVIYPNPFSNQLTVSAGLPLSEYDIIITDAQMKRVYAKNITIPAGVSSYQLDLSALSSGVYFLTLTSGEVEKPITLQIIKIDNNH